MAAPLIFVAEAWSPAAVRLLEPAQRYDTTGGMESIEDMRRANLPLIVARDSAGEALAAYVASWDAARKNLVVCAAGAAPGTSHITAAMDADVQARARALGATWCSAITRRPGLVRALTRAGWGVHGVILRRLMESSQ